MCRNIRRCFQDASPMNPNSQLGTPSTAAALYANHF